MNLIQKIKSINEYLFNNDENKKVLIIGPKNNFEIDFFIDLGFDLDVVEPNDSELKKDYPSVHFYNIKIEDFILESKEKYDCIFAQNVFYFVKNQEKIIEILSKNLKTDGIFCFTVMGEKDDWKEKEGINYLKESELIELKNKLLQENKLIFSSEECGLGNTMAGKIKNWHVYGFIFKRDTK